MESALLAEFAKFGLLGLITMLTGWIAFRKDSDLKDCQEKRIVMASELGKVIEATNAQNSELTRAIIESTKAQDRTNQVLERLERETERLQSDVRGRDEPKGRA